MTEKQQARTLTKRSAVAGTTVISTEMIGPHDVLAGRGGFTNNQNVHFRELVAEHQQEYLRARKMDKITIARRIVAAVHAKGGRFFKRASGGGGGDNHNNTESATWIELSDKRAQEKTSQALREGLCVRSNTIRPSKMIKSARMTLENNQPTSTGRKGDNNSDGKGVVSPSSSVNHPSSSFLTTIDYSKSDVDAHYSRLYVPEMNRQQQQLQRSSDPFLTLYSAALGSKSTKKEQV